MEVQQDPLWKVAKKRAGFKKHLALYVIVNSFLWAMWYFTERETPMWPIWTTLGWGIGLAFNFVDAYFLGDKDEMTRREYEKLKNSQKS